MAPPLVVVTSDAITHNDASWSGTPSTYVTAVAVSGCMPVQLPVIAQTLDPAPLLDVASGVLVTGSRSNVHPPLYGAEATEEAGPYDEARDRTTLPLIRETLRRGLPLLCICRGVQELNVALGGSLHAELHEVEGRNDHRSPPQPDLDARFALRHDVTVARGGCLAAILGDGPVFVNSVHRQGIDRIADGLTVEALAEDGTVEAVSVTGARAFALGVQWHPEHWVRTDPASKAIFEAFADACRAAQSARTKEAA
ncbi:gamma-glutamyl-gamma-aminobutyrate hydrolase [Acuticoccus sediminis]|uniref:gamma-glutamyl-gamma-aminobutyrate hydrolase n=1 Tax=Acuticoccus sediminis TaxID=2184697 RepID=A0A8B2P3D2_9HYPH|nr:gamma-glutamyl-gamma-aminobutyrate hydrolase family protein [Acuticoccus sediminis]RAI03642.1 gamma-glutamyl-gamma-aminobutyrate hydrolase [Acuticoccus sediminis]